MGIKTPNSLLNQGKNHHEMRTLVGINRITMKSEMLLVWVKVVVVRWCIHFYVVKREKFVYFKGEKKTIKVLKMKLLKC